MITQKHPRKEASRRTSCLKGNQVLYKQCTEVFFHSRVCWTLPLLWPQVQAMYANAVHCYFWYSVCHPTTCSRLDINIPRNTYFICLSNLLSSVCFTFFIPRWSEYPCLFSAAPYVMRELIKHKTLYLPSQSTVANVVSLICSRRSPIFRINDRTNPSRRSSSSIY